jgi:heme/copper-type cytochrome/quinol oxidase subunit 3
MEPQLIDSPGADARSLRLAGRLLAGAATFFFLAFLFAFFYLRSLDENHMWRPAHLKPDHTLGAVVVACVIASALLALVGGAQMRRRHSRLWVAAVSGSLLLGLAAVAVQCVQYTVQHFGPTGGGYASVFYGWTALYMVAVLGAMYWLETQLAGALRARRLMHAGAHPDGADPGGTHLDRTDPDAQIAPALDAAVFFWTYLAGLGVVMWVTLYLV